MLNIGYTVSSVITYVAKVIISWMRVKLSFISNIAEVTWNKKNSSLANFIIESV